MIRRRSLWLATALAVAVVLAGPAAPAHAAPRSPFGLDRLWGWLATVLPWAPRVQAAACDWGSHIDPDGGCRAAAAQPNGPDGQPAPSPDWGGYIDPDG